jgi:hypothetical protein
MDSSLGCKGNEGLSSQHQVSVLNAVIARESCLLISGAEYGVFGQSEKMVDLQLRAPSLLPPVGQHNLRGIHVARQQVPCLPSTSAVVVVEDQ